jgi:hypothetical protein
LRNYGGLKQRQNDVPAAEHERARAVEHVDELEGLRRDRCRKQRKTGQKCEGEHEQDGARAPPYCERQRVVARRCLGGQQQCASDPAEDDHRHLDEG